VGQVVAQLDRDQAIWSEWVDGASQVEIATRRGLDQSTVSDSIRRYTASIPEQEKREHRERMMARYEALYVAHRATALERPRVAAIVRGILDSQMRLLGLEPKELHVEGTIEHGHYVPGPTVAEILNEWREAGILRPSSSTTVERVT
jgi:hypothetical protein